MTLIFLIGNRAPTDVDPNVDDRHENYHNVPLNDCLPSSCRSRGDTSLLTVSRTSLVGSVGRNIVL